MDTTPEKLNPRPLVSILMLTYNRADYINEAVSSVLRQTYTNWQLTIIDDGSTDETQSIIENLKDPRILYIKNYQNKGLITRRIESLTHAKGTYTAILDSDDVWSSTDKLSIQVDYLENNPRAVLVGTIMTVVDKSNNFIKNSSYGTTDKSIRNSMLIRNQFCHSSVLMRTSVLTKKSITYRNTDLAEDYDLFLQLGNHGTFANIPRVMTMYRIHSNSFNNQKPRMANATLNIIKNHKNYPNYNLALVIAKLRVAYRKLKLS